MKAPKPLYPAEIAAQVENLRGSYLASLVPQMGGGGKLKSQFLCFVRCLDGGHRVVCTWRDWREAWSDFMKETVHAR